MNIYRSALHPDYIKKLRNAFRMQRCNAKRRGIEFKFTFETWLDLWLASGHLHERGTRKHQYVMARFNDVGDYEANNVRIITASENWKEGNNSPEHRSAVAKEVRNRPEVKAKIASQQIKFMTPDGEFATRGHAAKHYGISPGKMLRWMRSKPNEFYRIK